jgi:UDP-N-acetyl-D-glucosamine dehydrogenase
MKIGIVGLGYVGLPLAIAFCEAGHEVVGVDTDPRVADALAAGRSHVEDVSDESLAAISARFHPSSRYHDDFVAELPTTACARTGPRTWTAP